MKFATRNAPIKVILKDFLLNGKFDVLKLGVTKSWLQENFIEPDDVVNGETYATSPIWRYGNIELHFVKDVLWMIFSDYVDDLNGGDKIQIDKWILETQTRTKIQDWVRVFNGNATNFSIVHDLKIEQTRLVLSEEKNGVVLTFSNVSNPVSEPNDYELSAVQLWSTEFFET